jgi:hypothetical protein
MIVGSENKRKTDCTICEGKTLFQGKTMFAVGKSYGFFGEIYRTCPTNLAAGNEHQNCSQGDGRAKSRIGAVLDTSGQVCLGGDFNTWKKGVFTRPFSFSVLILDEESKGSKMLRT